MPEFLNQLQQQSKQLSEVIAGKHDTPVGTGRTDPTKLSYESDEQFEDSNGEPPSKQKQNRLKHGEALVHILNNDHHFVD